jgi:hypothetical protein
MKFTFSGIIANVGTACSSDDIPGDITGKIAYVTVAQFGCSQVRFSVASFSFPFRD